MQFIKFFAWEVKWVDRIMAARSREMQWLRKSKWTDFFVGFFWDIVPFGISIFSFMAFVLIAKGELTVTIAFPALTAFQLLTQALTKVRAVRHGKRIWMLTVLAHLIQMPMWANTFLQTYASLQRMDKYLNEDQVRSLSISLNQTTDPLAFQVPEWVSWQSSARMGTSSLNTPFDDRVGFDDASFAWISPNKEEAKKTPTPSILDRFKSIFKRKQAIALGPDTVAEEEPQRPFELRNLDITFIPGRINLITGPTGSGKSSREFTVILSQPA